MHTKCVKYCVGNTIFRPSPSTQRRRKCAAPIGIDNGGGLVKWAECLRERSARQRCALFGCAWAAHGRFNAKVLINFTCLPAELGLGSVVGAVGQTFVVRVQCIQYLQATSLSLTLSLYLVREWKSFVCGISHYI